MECLRLARRRPASKQMFRPALADRDIVGWISTGAGESNSLACESNEGIDGLRDLETAQAVVHDGDEDFAKIRPPERLLYRDCFTTEARRPD